MALGRAASVSPLSIYSGMDRGTPIDRYYIEQFLAAHASDIQGTVLELADDVYSRRFGAAKVIRQEVLDLDSNNANATIVGDICNPRTLPTAAFDCIVLTQALQYIFDLKAAAEQLRRSLRPGGVALITTPGMASNITDTHLNWYWSMTAGSLKRVLSEAFDPDKVEVRTFGNLFAATAFMHGAAVEEVPKKKLDIFDPAFPVTIAARAVA